MKKLFLAALLLSLSVCAFAQQDYVGRYDVFTGFSYLDSPKLDLQQRGFNTQLGVNLKRWLAFGADYSIQEGRASLVVADLKPSLQSLLASELPSPIVSALRVPFDATTQTYTIGPQVVWRPKHSRYGFFAHPSIGAIHENISLNATEGTPQPYATLVVGGLVQQGVLKTTKPNDTTYFYGLGGGMDYSVTKHLKLRADVEFVHVFLYSDLLKDSRNTVRLSVGPAFSFGHNVKK